MMRITIETADRARPAGPVWVDVASASSDGPVSLVDESDGRGVLAQVTDDGRLCWWTEPLLAGRPRRYRVEGVADVGEQRMAVDQSQEGQVTVTLDGELLTVYHFASDLVKPFLYPLIGPDSEPVTRHYPMRTDVAGEQHDHPHHRSCWVSWGDVNGVDHWSEAEGHGYQRHRRMLACHGGAVFARIVAVNDWCKADGTRQLVERRAMRFYSGCDGLRMFDLDVEFDFGDGDVVFGDTKEGGICAVRVASSMIGQGEGVIRNAAGGVGEAATWGKPAAWCDYVGPVAGRTTGIAILDAPQNFRHPVPWHVRDYGLMGANPFGLSYFTGDKSVDGSHRWRAGESVRFSYRVVIHRGDTGQADIEGHWLNFSQPLGVRVD